MLIWRGWGILVPIIPIFIWVLVPELFKSVLAQTTYTEYFKYISALSILLGAVALWILGKKLNDAEGRSLIDETTGEKVLLRANHSLFFINIEHWAVPLVILFIAMLFT